MTGSALTRKNRCGRVFAGVFGLLLLLAMELGLSVRRQSQTWNEALHLFAGYRYWQDLDFGINPEHPPLVKWLVAAPLLPLRLHVPLLPQGTSKQECYVAARKFMSANNAPSVLFRGRLVAGFLSLLLALVLFEATHQMFGLGPAFFALALAVFEPNLLGHGALATTDVGLACCLFAAVYSFYRHVKQRSLLTMVECGVTTGLTLAAKHSGLLVVPILASLAVFEAVRGYRLRSSPQVRDANQTVNPGRKALRLAGEYSAIALVALATLWGTYAFRFPARPRGKPMTTPLADYVGRMKTPLVSRAILRLEGLRVLPQSYLYGLADVLIVSAGPRPTFLLGRLYPRGQWFYFPASFIIKSTLGFLALLALALAGVILTLKESLRELVFVLLPPVLFFAASMTSGLDIGVRHILPIYPFLIVLIAAGAWKLAEYRRNWAYAVAAFSALHIISSLRSFPNYLAYSNEAWGGVSRTYKVLGDSNVDWGQGLKALRDYVESHRISDCWLAYFGSADPAQEGIPCKALPDPSDAWWKKPVNVPPEVFEGTVFISATVAEGPYWGPAELNPYGKFLNTPPADVLGGSILAFRGRLDLKTASHWSRLNRAWQLLADHKLEPALKEAREVAALEPRMVYARYTLGHMLAEAKQRDEAQREYKAALNLAREIQPDYQWYWVSFIQTQLDRLRG